MDFPGGVSFCLLQGGRSPLPGLWPLVVTPPHQPLSPLGALVRSPDLGVWVEFRGGAPARGRSREPRGTAGQTPPQPAAPAAPQLPAPWGGLLGRVCHPGLPLLSVDPVPGLSAQSGLFRQYFLPPGNWEHLLLIGSGGSTGFWPGQESRVGKGQGVEGEALGRLARVTSIRPSVQPQRLFRDREVAGFFRAGERKM